MPWTTEPPAFGFSAGRPWLPQPAGWGTKSVEAQRANPASMLALVREAIARRPHGAFRWRDSPAGTLVFERGDLVCSVNVDGGALPLRDELVLASETVGDELPPGAAAWTREA